ncbi:MAG: hypothetical protein QXH00_11125 [Candidatus Jordarchaeales archaeon]
MSRKVMARILAEMMVRLSLREEEELYRELLYYFGLVGAADECAALERAWEDPYVNSRIRDYIEAWIRKRRKQEQIAYAV